MKQRVAIACALSIRPKTTLLDEPFGALDALTRGGLQEQLMKIAQETRTHSASWLPTMKPLPLSDRIVLLTDRNLILADSDIPFPRPRDRWK